MLGAVDQAAIDARFEGAVARGEGVGLDQFHETLGAPPVGDEVGDGDQHQAVLAGEGDQSRQPHQAAIRLDDLADDAGGHAPRQARQIDGRFGMAGTGENAALAGTQGKDVTRPGEVAGADLPVAAVAGQGPDRPGPVGRRDAGGGAIAIVHGHGERRAVTLGVVLDHLRQVQFVEPPLLHGHADDARAVAHDEGDVVRRGLVGPPSRGRPRSPATGRPRRRACGPRRPPGWRPRSRRKPHPGSWSAPVTRPAGCRARRRGA